MSRSIARQQGATILGTLIVLMVAGVFFTVGFKLYTPYMDHMTIKSVVENTLLDQEEIRKPVSEIRRNIDRKLHINQVSLPDRENLKVEQREGMILFDLNYERRVPMFQNVDAVVKFDEHYEVVKP